MTDDPKLRAVLATLVRLCPHDDLVARLAYLVDWRTAITDGRQTTGVRWAVDARGPRLREVCEAARAERRRRASPLARLAARLRPAPDALDGADRASVGHVIREAVPLDRLTLVRLVMSTRPVMCASSDGPPPVADLPAIAALRNRDADAAERRAA